MATAEHESAEQLQAFNLWTFVHLKTPQFPNSSALHVVQTLSPKPGDDLKALAKRLRKELESHGVQLSHTAALDAAAKLAGFEGWFEAAKKLEVQIRFTAVRFLDGALSESHFSDWASAKPLMCKVCEDCHASTGATNFELKLGKKYLILSTTVISAGDDGPQVQAEPLLVISPVVPDDAIWLHGAAQAIETLRRHLEETGKATLDGAAVTVLCDNMTDALNSELVVLQSEHEFDQGFEIARGDEVECWSQMEFASKSDGGDATFEDENGAWLMGGRRFTWEVATIRPDEYIPGLRIAGLSTDASRKLFRRYQLLKTRTAGALPVRQNAKQFEALGAPAERYRVDLHKLLLEMNKKNLTWESYCAQASQDVAMEPMLPTGFLLELLGQLELADPNVVFARPSRSELAEVTDVKLLRTLIPRVSHIRYRTAAALSSDAKAVVLEAIEELSSSIVARQMTASPGILLKSDQLPHLVFAYDADELLGALSSQGLRVFVGVLPCLKPIELAQRLPNSAPFAFGLSLFLDIDVAGSAA